ncbi:MAG: 3-phosphoshikimate 1-carboxyvinyltransferase [Acidimicrobiales bacterium]|nr:3-phosphoshikimate 1-carboxyvinyltransferase [Acidimicrobiales bacterium]
MNRPTSRLLPDPLPIEPLGQPPDAAIRLPGSKSITNRALLTSALATGASVLRGVLVADDTLAMIDCLRSLGVTIEIAIEKGERDPAVAAGTPGPPTGSIPLPEARVKGTGGRWPVPTAQLDARQSGTTARFLLAAMALGDGPYLIDGDEQLRARPMGDLIGAMRELGVAIKELGTPGSLPVEVHGGLAAGHHRTITIPGDVSSQFLSGLLLSAPCYPNGIVVSVEGRLVSLPYVEMTMAVMKAFGAAVEQSGPRIEVEPTGYNGTMFAIEPDASAASYFFAAAAICGGRIRIDGLGSASHQGDVAFTDILEAMGAAVERAPDAIEVRGTGELHGVSVDLVDLSDTAPTLAVVASFADSPTEVRGIGFIRKKETDRIRAVVTELQRCGVNALELDDGFRIEPGPIRPTVVQTYDDHRMAMSFAVMGLRSPGIAISNPGCVAKTFPQFFEVLESLRR